MVPEALPSVPQRRAVILLSGGLDSATALAEARAAGFECYALTIDYGQRHRIELEAARTVSDAVGVREHRVVEVDLRQFGGSALTSKMPVPSGRTPAEMTDIPTTYVPARNTVFLSLALAWAEALGAQDIFIGVNALDYSVGGAHRVWIRTPHWARVMPIAEVVELPPDDYQTIAVDPNTLEIRWHPVTERLRHRVTGKRCFRIRLERGQEIQVTEDHSLFTVDPSGVRLASVKGCHVERGMPIAVPFDLSTAAAPWAADLSVLPLEDLATRARNYALRWSLMVDGEFLTNRLRRTRLPLRFPVSDDFLYVVGLWLAEGGKSVDSRTSVLAFSVGGIPGAVETMGTLFEPYGVTVTSKGNGYDYVVASSVFAAAFEYWGLFGTSKRGEKHVPSFFWALSQRQRRHVVAGLWDGDGGRVFNRQATLAQKSHALLEEVSDTFLIDGIFALTKPGRHSQRLLIINRAKDFQRFAELYPLRHPRKRSEYVRHGAAPGKDKTTGLWKTDGVWAAVAAAHLPPGEKTRVYNRGGKYDRSVRAQRFAFLAVPALRPLVTSKLAFLRVVDVVEMTADYMYDLSVDGAENFVAGGVLAHNSGYPDCRPEYIEAFERMANLATKAGVEGTARFRVHTPLLRLSKGEIVKRALTLGVDPRWTWSCYAPNNRRPCGVCDACVLRRKGFQEAGASDPLPAP